MFWGRSSFSRTQGVWAWLITDAHYTTHTRLKVTSLTSAWWYLAATVEWWWEFLDGGETDAQILGGILIGSKSSNWFCFVSCKTKTGNWCHCFIYTGLFVSTIARDSHKNNHFIITGTSKLCAVVLQPKSASIPPSFSISKHAWAERQLDGEKSACSGRSCCQTGKEPGDESFSIRPSAALLEQYRRQ